jgi:hypothetical protein
MKVTEEEMHAAAEAWLESHAAHRKYLYDTKTLFNLFVEGTFWLGSRRNVIQTFECYCRALLANSGYSHLEVYEFCLTKPNAEAGR